MISELKKEIKYILSVGRDVVHVKDLSRVLNVEEKKIEEMLKELSCEVSKLGIVSLKNFKDRTVGLLVNIGYREKKNKTVIDLFLRTKHGDKIRKEIEFRPYFYIDSKSYENLPPNLKKRAKEINVTWPINKAWRIELDKPREVPRIRRIVLGESYSADIPFVDRFMIDHEIGCGDILCIENDTIKKVTDQESIEFIALGFDIEVFNLEPRRFPRAEYSPVVLCAFEEIRMNTKGIILSRRKFTLGTFRTEYPNYIFCQNEKELLEKIQKTISDLCPDILFGYNIKNFDLPFLIDRCKKRHMDFKIGKKRLFYRKTYQAGSKQHGRKDIIEILGLEGIILLDIYELLMHNVLGVPLEYYSLDYASKKILNKEKELTHIELQNAMKTGKYKEVISYAEMDVELTSHLLLKQKYIERLFALSRLSYNKVENALRGQSKLVTNLLFKYFKENNCLVPNSPPDDVIEERYSGKIKGAEIFESEVGAHENVAIFDIKSTYPSIIIANNLCWTTETKEGEFRKDREGILPKICRDLLERRKSAKEKGEEALQYAYKILANSIYGYSGFVFARLFSLNLANAVTKYGREYLRKIKEIVEKRYKVIGGDTDSIFVKTDNLEECKDWILDECNKALPVELKFETFFKKMIIFTKKRYVGKDDSGKITTKGIELVRREWSKITKDCIHEIIDSLLEEKSIDLEKIKEIEKKYIEKLRKRDFEIDDIVLSNKISKPLEEYKTSLIHINLAKRLKEKGEMILVGMRIPYVVVSGKKDLNERGEKPELAKKEEIDIDYYIETQIKMPLSRIKKLFDSAQRRL